MSQYVCQECRAEVDQEAHRCPHCGHEAGEKILKRAKRQQKIGIFLSLFIIGIPIGVPLLLWGGFWKRKAKKRTVGVTA